MIQPVELQRFAERLIEQQPAPNEAMLRRAVSALYYGLFHSLALASAESFASGGTTLVARAARAFDHRTMLAVCQTFAKARTGPLPEPYAGLLPKPDPLLAVIARAFVQLQEARHIADYDLASALTQQEALDLLRTARSALRALVDAQGSTGARIFLTALLLNDRWARRG